jgi:hypothetical protein
MHKLVVEFFDPLVPPVRISWRDFARAGNKKVMKSSGLPEFIARSSQNLLHHRPRRLGHTDPAKTVLILLEVFLKGLYNSLHMPRCYYDS